MIPPTNNLFPFPSLVPPEWSHFFTFLVDNDPPMLTFRRTLPTALGTSQLNGMNRIRVDKTKPWKCENRQTT